MSGPDVFALPPSGHTYSYPGQVGSINNGQIMQSPSFFPTYVLAMYVMLGHFRLSA